MRQDLMLALQHDLKARIRQRFGNGPFHLYWILFSHNAGVRSVPEPPAAQTAFFKEPFVITHLQMRFQLHDGIERHTDHDEHAGTAEIKINVEQTHD